MMLTELRKVIPSFLQRVDRPDRGGSGRPTWPSTRDGTARVVERLWPDAGRARPGRPARPGPR